MATFLSSSGTIVLQLVKDLMEEYGLRESLAVFEAEAGFYVSFLTLIALTTQLTIVPTWTHSTGTRFSGSRQAFERAKHRERAQWLNLGSSGQRCTERRRHYQHIP